MVVRRANYTNGSISIRDMTKFRLENHENWSKYAEIELEGRHFLSLQKKRKLCSDSSYFRISNLTI